MILYRKVIKEGSTVEFVEDFEITEDKILDVVVSNISNDGKIHASNIAKAILSKLKGDD